MIRTCTPQINHPARRLRAMVLLEDVVMRMIAFVMTLWAGLTAAFAGDGFVVDMEADDIWRLDGHRYLMDVPIGETVEVDHLPRCLREGQMVLMNHIRLKDHSNRSIREFVTRETETDVTVRLEATDRASREDIRRVAAWMGGPNCDETGGWTGRVPTYRVMSINGATSLTDLLKTPPFAGVVMY